MQASYQSYMICTAPRSGSTLLCGLLAATRAAGAPNSHFHLPSLDAWLADYGLADNRFPSNAEALHAVLKVAIQRGTGGNDIFGLRMQRGSFEYFIEQLETLGPDDASDVARIESIFGRTLFIHLSRSDLLGQAISRVRAEQSGLWHRNADGTELERLSDAQEIRYDAAAIRSHMAELRALQHSWTQWFKREGIDPICVDYEPLSDEPRRVLADILAALSLDPKLAETVEIPTAKLADATSHDWRKRFECEV